MKGAEPHVSTDDMNECAVSAGPEGARVRLDRLLRAKARELIRSGNVPKHLPKQRWGGPGMGMPCTVCREPVERHEVDVEVEFTCNGGGNASNHHFHLRCLTALERELREIELAGYAAPGAGEMRSTAAPAGAVGACGAASS
jgi:hypothetical protein